MRERRKAGGAAVQTIGTAALYHCLNQFFSIYHSFLDACFFVFIKIETDQISLIEMIIIQITQ